MVFLNGFFARDGQTGVMVMVMYMYEIDVEGNSVRDGFGEADAYFGTMFDANLLPL